MKVQRTRLTNSGTLATDRTPAKTYAYNRRFPEAITPIELSICVIMHAPLAKSYENDGSSTCTSRKAQPAKMTALGAAVHAIIIFVRAHPDYN